MQQVDCLAVSHILLSGRNKVQIKRKIRRKIRRKIKRKIKIKTKIKTKIKIKIKIKMHTHSMAWENRRDSDLAIANFGYNKEI